MASEASPQIGGIGISGLATAKPSIMIALSRVIKSVGGTAKAFSLRGQSSYVGLAWSSWTEIKAEALMRLQRIADTNSDEQKANVVFAHSIGGVVGLLAAEEYTRERPRPSGSNGEDSDEQLDNVLEPGAIDKFVAFNASFSPTWWVWIGMAPCLLLLMVFGNVPVIGHLVKLIPVWKIRAASGSKELSWLPLGGVLLVWRAIWDMRKLIKRLERENRRLPFEVVLFVGTSDFVCSHYHTRSVADRLGATFVPIAMGLHSPDLKSPLRSNDSEWEVKFRRVLLGKDPSGLRE